jgi:hypothetical protein
LVGAPNPEKMTVVTWKRPILISIESWPPVMVNRSFVPNTDDDFMGVDVLSKHTIILSSKNMEADLRIYAGE